MIVNLNCLCKVHLTDVGKQIWLQQLEGIPEEFIQAMPDLPQQIKDAIKEDDTLELPLWQVMNLYGQFISDKSLPFKTTTIEINKNPDFFKQIEQNKVD